MQFPPICKQEPLEVQMHYIKEHFALTGKKIRLEDVPKTMYGGALPVEKGRKSKRKALTKEEYLEDESEEPKQKKAKKDKKEKTSSKLKVGSSGLPTIQEEVQDLDTNTVLNRRTRSGKAATSTQTAPEQPPVPKKKRKTVVRKLKESVYVAEDEEEIEAATELVTREVKKNKKEDAATLARIRELAKGIEVPASSIAREDDGVIAQQLVQATEEVQEMTTSEAGNMLMVVKAGEEVHEDNTGGSDSAAPEADTGNPDSSHTLDVIVVESDSTRSASSQSTSSSSLNLEDIPLSQIFSTSHKGLSPSTKLHKKLADNTPSEPIRSDIDERIIGLSQWKTDFCNRLPVNHPFKPPMI
jgi:hypothetical protein